MWITSGRCPRSSSGYGNMDSRKQPHLTTAKVGLMRDKRILATGAISGIGLATTELLAAEGAIVGIQYNKNKAAAHALLVIAGAGRRIS